MWRGVALVVGLVSRTLLMGIDQLIHVHTHTHILTRTCTRIGY